MERALDRLAHLALRDHLSGDHHRHIAPVFTVFDPLSRRLNYATTRSLRDDSRRRLARRRITTIYRRNRARLSVALHFPTGSNPALSAFET